jgi:catechol 2,3-dioxygenase-like lactoylglutathione lyase family enzyme
VRLQHVTVTVPAEKLIAPAGDFYRTLGGVPLHRPARLAADTPGCWLGFGGGTQVHVVVGDPPATQAHFALDLGDRYDDVLAALDRAGTPIRTARDLWGGRRSFVADPAGNRVEIFDRPPPSEPSESEEPDP